MRHYLIILFLFLSVSILAQNEDISEKVIAIEKKINTAEKGEKLKWKDSLLKVIEFNEAYSYSKKIEETIAYAIAIDSIPAATRLTSDIVFYKTHRLQQAEESIKKLKEL